MHKLPIIMACILAGSAALAEGEKAGDKDARGAPGNNVEMPYVMAPMTNTEGKLSGYAYISPLVVATGLPAALSVRDKLAFLQDAFIRDVNATPITSTSEAAKIDVTAVQGRFLADAQRIVGAAKVKSVLVCSVQIAELHPKQTPDLYTPPKEAIQQSVKDGKPVKKSPCDS